MTALEELPDKAKDIMLPVIPLRGWVGSYNLENSIDRVRDALEDRYWVADIDSSFLSNIKLDKDGNPRPVFEEISSLLDSKDGFKNWYDFLCAERHSNLIPVIQLSDMSQLGAQIERLNSLNRGVVALFNIADIEAGRHKVVLSKMSELQVTNAFIIFDYGQVDREVLTFAAAISTMISEAYSIFPAPVFSLSCSSFPSSFSSYNRGSNSIYERQLYNTVDSACPDITMIYSDRAGARAKRLGGGGGVPYPRIDYPYANEWFFILGRFEDYKNPKEGEREELYQEIAQQIMREDYWQPDLHVWGTQVIELTSKQDKYGITSAMRATAVRLNIHMHQQLYYNDVEGLLDTDEDWQD